MSLSPSILYRRPLPIICAASLSLCFGLSPSPLQGQDSASSRSSDPSNSASVSGGDPSVDGVLKQILAGNRRFVSGKLQHPHESRHWRKQLEAGQHPVAVVVGCSDSRVTPELIFDQGLGDLFVVRVAGNIVDTDVVASVEYAVDHLDTHLIIVLGHSGCGAVTAALEHAAESTSEPDEVVSLLYRIEPALREIPASLSQDERLQQAIANNVERSAERLSHVPDLMKSLKKGRAVIVGAIYDMHSGNVEVISRIDREGHHRLQVANEN